MVKWLSFYISLFLFSQANAQDSLRTYYAWSLDAYKQKDYSLYLKYARRANELRPNHPILGYNIASALALNGKHQESIAALKHYLQMNASMDYMQDLDFISLKDYPEFKQLKKIVNERLQKVESSDSWKNFSQKEDHFESIGYNLKDQTVMLGTITTRTLYSMDNGELDKVLDNEKEPLTYGVMGIDYADDYIWVCTAALPEINNYQKEYENRSSIIGLHPGNYKVKFAYEVPNALLGDIIYVHDDLVLASDGLNNKVYQVTKSGASVYADFSDDLFNVQGIAWVNNKLILSDYILGLHTYDPQTKELIKIDSRSLYADKGIDGILYDDGYLYCFQNGTTPKRTFKIKLNDFQVDEVEVIDQNLYDQAEPTQGVKVDNDIYYISNSAWNAYEEGTYTGGDDLVIRKIKK